MLSDEELRKNHPTIVWDKPIRAKVPHLLVERFCCRYCIAQKGIADTEVGQKGFTTESEFREHITEVHHRAPIDWLSE